MPLTTVLRSKGSAPSEPLSFPLMPRVPLLLTCGCVPLPMYPLGWLAQGHFEKIRLVPVPTVDSTTPLHRAVSLTVPC